MIKVSLIGNGNVSRHLASAFEQHPEIQLVQVYSRSSDATGKFVKELSALREADIYIIAISDNSISELSGQLPFTGKLVVHTSGSVPMTALDPENRRGVFYPLQTFSKEKPVNWTHIPICIESELAADYDLLMRLAHTLSPKVFKIDSEQRRALHVAAVFASNFTNHLYAIAEEICKQHQMPFEILLPLISETAAKVQVLSPVDAQTGPARRDDINTINSHLALLHDQRQKQIYELLTNSIKEYGKKL